MIKKFKRHFELSPVSKEDAIFIILPAAVGAGIVSGIFTLLILTIINH